MKKALIGSVAVLMVFALSGCSKQKTQDNSTLPVNESINQQTKEQNTLPQSQEKQSNNPNENTSSNKNKPTAQEIDDAIKSIDDINIDDATKDIDDINIDETDSIDLNKIEE